MTPTELCEQILSHWDQEKKYDKVWKLSYSIESKVREHESDIIDALPRRAREISSTRIGELQLFCWYAEECSCYRYSSIECYCKRLQEYAKEYNRPHGEVVEPSWPPTKFPKKTIWDESCLCQKILADWNQEKKWAEEEEDDNQPLLSHSIGDIVKQKAGDITRAIEDVTSEIPDTLVGQLQAFYWYVAVAGNTRSIKCECKRLQMFITDYLQTHGDVVEPSWPPTEY